MALFVFVAMKVGSRRILHCNVTAHPTADWTLQQLREAMPSDHPYQFLIHDRDSIFASALDEELKSTFGLRVLLTPVQTPQANAYCERLIGTVRREYLDFMIPLNERHLRGSLRSWAAHSRGYFGRLTSRIFAGTKCRVSRRKFLRSTGNRAYAFQAWLPPGVIRRPVRQKRHWPVLPVDRLHPWRVQPMRRPPTYSPRHARNVVVSARGADSQ